MRFCGSSSVFFSSDSHGLTTMTHFVRRGLLYFTEKRVHQGAMPVQDLILARGDAPFPLGIVVFATGYVVFNPAALSTSLFGSDKPPVVFESAPYEDPPSVTILAQRTSM